MKLIHQLVDEQHKKNNQSTPSVESPLRTGANDSEGHTLYIVEKRISL